MKALLLITVIMSLCAASCARPHDDGMGDLWRGVRQTMQ